MNYLSHSEADIKKMLDSIGVGSIDRLFDSIPEQLRLKQGLNLPKAMSEWELEEYISSILSEEGVKKSFLGGGSYNHYIPSIIPYLTSRSEFLTSYTPYQPEISQGTLQALFEFQTYIATYLGMDYANASMYDGASSFAEGVLMSARVTKRSKVLVSEGINPRYLEVLRTYAKGPEIEIIILPLDSEGKTELSTLTELSDIASVAIQSPNYFGIIEDMDLVKPIIAEEKTLFIAVFSEILSFGLYNPPGFYGADLACGEAQSFGINRGFGGPSLGIFTFNKKYLRNVPGRIVGETLDKNEERSFALTLATREQHIRREKATSNICSNQGLCTLSCIIYMSLLGNFGLKKLAQINYNNAAYLKAGLIKSGAIITYKDSDIFNEFIVRFPSNCNLDKFKTHGIVPGIKIGDEYLVTVTEVFSKKDLDTYIAISGGDHDL